MVRQRQHKWTQLADSSCFPSRNFEKIVLIAYEWLSENYRPNDRIYLFGTYRLYENVVVTIKANASSCFRVFSWSVPGSVSVGDDSQRESVRFCLQ